MSNGIDHFKLRRAHRLSMSAVTNIEDRTLTSSNGNGHKMQGSEHLPDKLPLGMRVRSHMQRLGAGWHYVVVNKSIDSVTMPKWIASSILGTVLLFGVSSWWRSSDQRDMLIELKTELRLAKESEKEKSLELKNQADMNKVYIDNMTNQLNTIRGMLSQQQLNNINKGTN